MTTAERKCLERSPHCLPRLVRKPAWDFHRFVSDPWPAQGRRWQFPTLMQAVRGGFWTKRGS